MSGAKNPAGRPSRYNAVIADAICWQLVEGRSLRDICSADDVPDRRSIQRWLDQREDFRLQYARAKELQAHCLADECLDIADKSREGTAEQIQSAKLRVDTRKWFAGKLLPKVYGDKLLHTGADGMGPIEVKPLSLDYTLLEPQEMLEFRRMLAKMERKGAPPMIEGNISDGEE